MAKFFLSSCQFPVASFQQVATRQPSRNWGLEIGNPTASFSDSSTVLQQYFFSSSTVVHWRNTEEILKKYWRNAVSDPYKTLPFWILQLKYFSFLTNFNKYHIHYRTVIQRITSFGSLFDTMRGNKAVSHSVCNRVRRRARKARPKSKRLETSEVEKILKKNLVGMEKVSTFAPALMAG